MSSSSVKGEAFFVTFWIFIIVFFAQVESLAIATQDKIGLISAVTDPIFFPDSERQALRNIFYTTHGKDWSWLTPYSTYGIPWNFSDPNVNPCQMNWQGISCTATRTNGSIYNYVDSLQLSAHKMRGEITPNISTLIHLQALNLSNNRIHGTIPNEIRSLTSLVTLTLNDNNIVGTFPLAFAQLSKLRSLYLQNNLFSGILAGHIGNLTDLTVLNLGNNFFHGTLPRELGQLINLRTLYLSRNEFWGSLPKEIGQLHGLLKLYIDANSIRRSIPSELCDLTNLRVLSLAGNDISGSIPTCILNITQLEVLSIPANNITGSIPAELGQLTSLQSILLGDNYITGSIPETIGQLANLQEFNISSNYITGSIPSSIGQNVLLDELLVAYNLITGSIPPEICQLELLQKLFIQYNIMTSSIPPALGNLSQLAVLYIYNNVLTGSLPSSMGNLSQLKEIDTYANPITGSIPNSMCQLSVLRQLYLDYNMLSGTIPAQIGQFSNLRGFHLQDNYLSGTLPSFAGNLSQLSNLEVNNNQLSGTLPDSLRYLTDLNELHVDNNRLQGRNFSALQTLMKLSIMMLSDNEFSGPAAAIVPVDITWKRLKVLDISNNLFTGSLPDISGLQLKTFVAAVNCIRSPIAESSICAAQQLEVLILDGLYAAQGCDHGSDPHYYSGGGIGKWALQPILRRDGIVGSLPSCLWTSLPHLKTLHLSDNGIRGTLPSNYDVGLMDNSSSYMRLTNLSLSHNFFTGTVPSWIWQHDRWINLDLSFNRLTGNLPDDLTFPSTGTLYLNLNRFSGKISDSLLSVSTIEILDGNIFECIPWTRSDLPYNDVLRPSYVCGSDTVNAALIVWVLLVVLVVVIRLFHGTAQNTDDTSKQRAFTSLYEHFVTRVALITKEGCDICIHDAVTQNALATYFTDLHFVVRCLRRYLVAVFVVGLPVYGTLTVFYGSYASQYVWTLSACYLVGVLPTVVMLVLFIVLLVTLDIVWQQKTDDPPLETVANPVGTKVVRGTTHESSQRDLVRENTSIPSHGSLVSSLYSRCISRCCKEQWIVWFLKGVLVLSNAIFVISINGTYIFALGQNSLGVYRLILITLALSTFKIAWSWVILHKLEAIVDVLVYRCFGWTTAYLATCGGHEGRQRGESIGDKATEDGSIDGAQDESRSMPAVGVFTGFGIRFTAWLTVFNNIMAPYVAELIVNPNCFRFVFTPAPKVTSSYALIDGCLTEGYQVKCFPETTTLSYQPAFTYNYLCSSSLVTSFAFVFILRYLLSGIVLPVLLLSIHRLLEVVYARRTEVALYRVLWQFAEMVVPEKHRPVQWWIDTFHGTQHGADVELSPIKPAASELPKRSQLRSRAVSADVKMMENPLQSKHQRQNRTHRDGESKADIERPSVDHPAEPHPRNLLGTQRDTESASPVPSQGGPLLVTSLVHTRKQVVVRIVSDTACFLTYGVLFPPLTIVILCSLIVESYLVSYQWIRLSHLLEHFRLKARSASSLFLQMVHQTMLHDVRQLAQRHAKWGESAFPVLRQLSGLVACFWSFVLFDTMGGSDHQSGSATNQLQLAIICTVLMATAPLWIWLVRKAGMVLRLVIIKSKSTH